MYPPSRRMQVPRRWKRRQGWIYARGQGWICARVICGDLSRLSSFMSLGRVNSMKSLCSRAVRLRPTFLKIARYRADWQASSGLPNNRHRRGVYWSLILGRLRWVHPMIRMHPASPLGRIAVESASQVVFFRPGPPTIDALDRSFGSV
jgi:hypothetical protein